ncbi:MAG: hypothetical protein ABSH34_07110 [Verrucomicrobiota bacterium]|jgi:hypothetical protein
MNNLDQLWNIAGGAATRLTVSDDAARARPGEEVERRMHELEIAIEAPAPSHEADPAGRRCRR